MAKATKIEKEVKVKVVDKINLELTPEEALTIRLLVGNVGGISELRKCCDSIYCALDQIIYCQNPTMYFNHIIHSLEEKLEEVKFYES